MRNFIEILHKFNKNHFQCKEAPLGDCFSNLQVTCPFQDFVDCISDELIIITFLIYYRSISLQILHFNFFKVDFRFDIRLHYICVETNSNLEIIRSLLETWDFVATRPWLTTDGSFTRA